MNEDIKEQIASAVIHILIKRFETFPEDETGNRNAPFHEAFLEAFGDKLTKSLRDDNINISYFISLNSWLHGLNTALGQSFFEKIAHILSNGEKREYTAKKKGNLKIPLSQKNKIDEIVTALSNGQRSPNRNAEIEEILTVEDENEELSNVQDFTADVFIEDRNTVTAIELKTVKPNSSNMISEKRKITEGHIALRRKFPDKEVNFYLSFPFDPTSCTDIDYNKDRFLRSIVGGTKFFAEDEILLSAELWDELSGEKNTMKQILSIINVISTRDFQKNCCFLNDNNNRSKPEYLKILQEWSLYTETTILNNETYIKEAITDNRRLNIIFNSEVIKTDGYNMKRKQLLEYVKK